ncbi:MAG: heparinase II/III family protein [Pseudomonadota bacterium]
MTKINQRTGHRVSGSRSKFHLRGVLERARIRRAARGAVPKGFVDQPEPRSIGSFARGRQLLAGNIQFTGHLVELKGKTPWRVIPPSQGFARDLHGFLWLDDLAAIGTPQARAMAQVWVLDWIKRYRNGHGPGWDSDIAARRLIRWIHHGLFLVSNLPKPDSDQFFRCLAQHTRNSARFLAKPPPGLPGFEASVGTVYASLTVQGLRSHTKPALAALCRLCSTEIDPSGAIASRNPEELLDIFTLLNWAQMALEHASVPVPSEVSQAIKRIAPTLRVLRHSNGHLTRFHGGGRGAEGRLDEALAQSGIRATAPKESAMGYIRVTSGTTTLMVDAAAPAFGGPSRAAHASTAGFELTSGKTPLIVSCGSGASFGEEWRLAGRATPSHSTLGLDGMSSSRFAPGTRGAFDALTDVPTVTDAARIAAIDGTRVRLRHDGYGASHGLAHGRTLDLTIKGQGLAGEDTLLAETPEDKVRLRRKIDQDGVTVSIRFHLHPDVDAHLDLNGKAVSLALPDASVWVFRHDGFAHLSLEPGVYLEQGRVMPRTADQIVLSYQVTDTKTQVRWTLAKLQDARAGTDET